MARAVKLFVMDAIRNAVSRVGGRAGGDVAHAEALAEGQLAVDHDSEREAGQMIRRHAAGHGALDLGERSGQPFAPVGTS